MIRTNTPYIGRGRRSEVFTLEEEEKMVRIMLERSGEDFSLTYDIVKNVLEEEMEFIKINEPNRGTFTQSPETGEILMKDYFIRNFLQRHDLNKHLMSVKSREMKERPFECVICHKKYGFKNVLVKHYRSVHKDFEGYVF